LFTVYKPTNQVVGAVVSSHKIAPTHHVEIGASFVGWGNGSVRPSITEAKYLMLRSCF